MLAYSITNAVDLVKAMGIGQSVTFSELTQKTSCCRTHLMGVAMLMVILFHCRIMPFFWFGYWGVDIFLFLSGFSIYFSLSKKGTLPIFYLKRFLRIMPGAIICGIAFFYMGYAHGEKDIALWGLNLWYVRSILIFYFLSPFLFIFLKRWKTKALLFLIILAEVTAYLFADCIYVGRILTVTLSWSFARLPIYLLGMALPIFSKEKEISVSIRCLLFSALVGIMILGELRVYQIYHNLDVVKLLFMPSLLLSPTILLMSIFWVKWMRILPPFLLKIIYLFGFYSLEIYLIHESILKFNSKIAFYVQSALLSKMMCIIVSVLLAYFLNVTCSRIQTFFLKKNDLSRF